MTIGVMRDSSEIHIDEGIARIKRITRPVVLRRVTPKKEEYNKT
jgi:hypothetical protein